MIIGIDARWIFPEITGIGSYTQELIRHLLQQDSPHQFVLYFRDQNVRDRTMAYAEADAHPRVRTRLLPYGPFAPASQLRLPAALQQDRLDIFHSTNFMMPLWKPLRHTWVSVITIHDLIPLLFPEHTPKALKTRFHPVYRAIMRRIGRQADLILTVSESSRRDILQHMAIPADRQDRVVSVYEGVAERYQPDPAGRPANAPPVILYVGRLDPYKNVVALLRAFARLRNERGIDARLRLIGPPDARYPEAQQVIVNEKLSAFIDGPAYVSGAELLRAYQQAAVFVLPSLYEGFGLPVLEAMACGTPVICSHCASLPEVAGDAAITFDPHQPDQLVDALESILTDPARAAALSQAGLQRAAQFRWQRTAAETLAAYELAVQKESRPTAS
jgi:glycosyltransferase involved in cell wall biosynthesis